MKRILAVLLAATLSVTTLCACGSKSSAGEGSAAASGSGSAALDYPKQNVNVIVQYSAGGGTDLSVRGVLSGVKDFPVNLSVSNVAGNGGLIGLTQVSNSKADGYTLGVVNTDFVINGILGNTELTLDDFSPLACALKDPFVLIVGKTDKYSDLKGFVEYAKNHPGEVSIGDTGTGAAPTLAVTAIQNALGIQLKSVTYDGSADCVTAVVGNHIDATIAQACNASAQVEAGNAKIIGVLANDRLKTYPDAPTFKETFPDQVDFEMMGFCIISCPSKVDQNIQKYLSEQLRTAVDSTSFSDTLKKLNMQDTNMTVDEMKQFLDEQKKLYTKLCSKTKKS
ncbi:tripartite tricarboxylate transporter substrate binding protein [Caproiciproducens sp. NJN-50]|uniref:tripartite tricarboxylate transporter substrate binding protein n=1 Tax=Acutalibacteraceae TaxID=3082771 RepID=UPI000FFE221A|nr:MULTISPECIES: tripartite tricarboxylate transporter substrate binding protein [Acutalibacteraceae]QAT50046.1 tripartite tricarboxylate transporter substrate binding protein [Caproiciproducens sp. NJN-50]